MLSQLLIEQSVLLLVILTWELKTLLDFPMTFALRSYPNNFPLGSWPSLPCGLLRVPFQQRAEPQGFFDPIPWSILVVFTASTVPLSSGLNSSLQRLDNSVT